MDLFQHGDKHAPYYISDLKMHVSDAGNQNLWTNLEPWICAALFLDTKFVIFSCNRSLAWQGKQVEKVVYNLLLSKPEISEKCNVPSYSTYISYMRVTELKPNGVMILQKDLFLLRKTTCFARDLRSILVNVEFTLTQTNM